MTVSIPFKAAVLVNSISALDDAFSAAFQECISSACPGAQVDFFDPIEAQIYPEPGQYDLIVLTGGTADAMAKDVHWVLKMQDFLRTTVEKCPTQKIVGICWGHQIIHVTFGGVVGPMDKFEVGVTPITLTSAGSSFFSSYLPSREEYKVHEFHEQEVKTPGKGFIALAEDNQSLVNATNTILTLQGHPEMSAELSKLLLGDTPQYKGVHAAAKEALEFKINSSHDGSAIWKRIIHWTGEV
ncbi:class I glutamine amidotransferase-like protein [Clohesyomyces aquaticus]|uniref:Class I glutamine amidotransferase-like protein n=1 Tax=Clohesyomyces aquaticus TaxID=1231657 RepID=A0A1Y1YZT3_9PLEO|nr:class I glutamine amidotransferase-like protein [Clohesyomyces aquaticus]